MLSTCPLVRSYGQTALCHDRCLSRPSTSALLTRELSTHAASRLANCTYGDVFLPSVSTVIAVCYRRSRRRGLFSGGVVHGGESRTASCPSGVTRRCGPPASPDVATGQIVNLEDIMNNKILPTMPQHVDGYRVKPVFAIPKPAIAGRQHIVALVCSDEEDYEDFQTWGPPIAGNAQMQAMSVLNDAFGVVGVWPAAWVAADRVLTLCQQRSRVANAPPLRVMEVACGAGLPSLCALAAGASVFATDLEELPLRLLSEAAEWQFLPGQLETRTLDMTYELPPAGGFDVIVCSDCLYKADVAVAVAKFFVKVLLRRPGTELVVTCPPNRSGEQAFLDELSRGLGLGIGESTKPVFEAVDVPAWAADEAYDPFDGTVPEEVGLLRLYSSPSQ